MFGKHHTLKQLSVGIAVAASLAVVAVPSALGAHDSWYRNAVSQTASRQSVPFITDTLGGNGNSEQATVRGYRFITDTLGGNGHVTQVSGYNPQAYVYGGASPAVSKAIQALGNGRTASPPVATGSSGTSFSWGDAGVGAGIAAGLMLLLLGGTRLRMNKRSVLTA
jgi:hypothetical protein